MPQPIAFLVMALASVPAPSASPAGNASTQPLARAAMSPVDVPPSSGPTAAATPPIQRVSHARASTRRPRHHKSSGSSLRAVQSANRSALAAPRASAFLNANLIYDYEQGRLYQIDASPRFLTTIALRPGERLVSKAAGDTVRWVLGETVQGQGESAQTLVLVKPVRGGEKTNLVLTTDQRTYLLQAVSHEDPIYTSLLSWNYPADQMRDAALAAAKRHATERTSEASTVEGSVALASLNFAYRIEHPGERRGPSWEPVRVFDDGSKTYIQFPPALATMQAPPLFLLGPGDKAELVNYRVRGGYYVVDRLMERAELRLGEKPQAIVRITKLGVGG